MAPAAPEMHSLHELASILFNALFKHQRFDYALLGHNQVIHLKHSVIQ
jgi:hypothetical protein